MAGLPGLALGTAGAVHDVGDAADSGSETRVSRVVPGLDGTICVHVHVLAEKREVTAAPDPDGPPAITWAEPQVYDAFEADGPYLGQVRIPPRTSIYVFSRSDLWGVRRGDFDEQYAVRLRLEDPREMLETSRTR